MESQGRFHTGGMIGRLNDAGNAKRKRTEEMSVDFVSRRQIGALRKYFQVRG